jgi:hypothetical protein
MYGTKVRAGRDRRERGTGNWVNLLIPDHPSHVREWRSIQKTNYLRLRRKSKCLNYLSVFRHSMRLHNPRVPRGTQVLSTIFVSTKVNYWRLTTLVLLGGCFSRTVQVRQRLSGRSPHQLQQPKSIPTTFLQFLTASTWGLSVSISPFECRWVGCKLLFHSLPQCSIRQHNTYAF